MKIPPVQGIVLFFVSVATVSAQSSGTAGCPYEPNWLNNDAHYFCNIERIGQLTLQWIVKSPYNLQSTIATCDTKTPGLCMNSDPCFQATIHPDGVSELRLAMYYYNNGGVECHGSRDNNDMCKFTLSSSRDQEALSFLSTSSMCNLTVSTVVPNVDRTFNQSVLKSTTKVVSDKDASSSSDTTINVNPASITTTRINVDFTSVKSIRNESTRQDTTDTARLSTLLTKRPSTNRKIISNFTTQKSMYDLVSTTISPQKSITTTKATTIMNGDLQSIAIGATAAFVATVCVTGMILISLYRRSRKSFTHTNILKERQDKTTKHFGEADGFGGNSPTSTSMCVCLNEIELPTSLATDSSCFPYKKPTSDLIEMLNPVYSSSSLASEIRSENERFDP